MSNYPTLSKQPKSVKIIPLDNAVKTQSERGGPICARARGTKQLYRLEVFYPALSSADWDLLFHPSTGFYATVGTYDIFNFTFDGITYAARFAEPPPSEKGWKTGTVRPVSFVLEST